MSAPAPHETDQFRAYEAGYRSGRRWIEAVNVEDQVAIDAVGTEYDLIALAVEGYLPDDLREVIEERVDAVLVPYFNRGFVSACEDYRLRLSFDLDDQS